MHTWLTHMPKGMRLKSEGFASSLYDPGSTFTLEVYCKEKGIPYGRLGRPVPLEVFTAYGLEFQKRFVPGLETKMVESLKRSGDGFQLGLDSGETLSARRVVMAVGLTHYHNFPGELAGLPPSLVSHSSKHSTVDQFRGREVAIVGAGASALDLAALLNQAGARVQVLSRKPVIKFHDPPEKLEFSFFDQLRNPITGIGPGWKLFWCANTPLLFRQMPLKFRLDRVKNILGPAPCWFIKEEIIGKVQLIVDVSISEAKVQDGRVCLQLTDSAGTRNSITVDHVIAATGYKVKLHRLAFMDAQLQSAIRSVEDTPVLSSNFQSTVPGLYFVGASAANTFGPLLRFAFGAGFTAGRLSKHLAKLAIRRPATDRSSSEIRASDRDEVSVR
jgi:thioredoxin reductase